MLPVLVSIALVAAESSSSGGTHSVVSNTASRCLCNQMSLQPLFIVSPSEVNWIYAVSLLEKHMTILWFLVSVSWAVVSVSIKPQLNSAETVCSRMHPVRWFFAALLAAGTSELCCAGPLHAQCKVEWYALFLLYILSDVLCLIFITKKYLILHNSAKMSSICKI